MDTKEASGILNNHQEFHAVSSWPKRPDHRGFHRPGCSGKPAGFGIAAVHTAAAEDEAAVDLGGDRRLVTAGASDRPDF